MPALDGGHRGHLYATWPPGSAALSDGTGILRVMLIVAVCQMCLHYADLYDLTRIRNVRVLLARLLIAVGATSVILALLYLWFPGWMIGPGVFLITGLLVVAVVPSWRLSFAWLTPRIAPRKRLLIVGTSPAAVKLARELNDRRHELGVEIVGFADSDVERIGHTVLGRVVGAVEDIPAMIRRLSADRIVVSLGTRGASFRWTSCWTFGCRPTSPSTISHPPTRIHRKDRGRSASSQLVRVLVRLSQDPLAVAGKTRPRCRPGAYRSRRHRAFLLVAAALIKLTSPGGALYRQARVGLNGRVFTIYKLRTMRRGRGSHDRTDVVAVERLARHALSDGSYEKLVSMNCHSCGTSCKAT